MAEYIMVGEHYDSLFAKEKELLTAEELHQIAGYVQVEQGFYGYGDADQDLQDYMVEHYGQAWLDAAYWRPEPNTGELPF